MKLEIKSEVIENAIKDDFRKNFDPQTPKLDFYAEFEYKDKNKVYKLEVPYFPCMINIYMVEEIDCKCGVFEVELTIIEDTKGLSIALVEIAEELTEDFKREVNEPDDRLTIAKDYADHM